MSTYDQPDFTKHTFDAGATSAGFGEVEPGGVFIFSRPGKLDNEQSLRSYLLVRALGRSVMNTVLWSGLLILAIGVVLWLSGLKVLGILVGLVAFAVLFVRFSLGSLTKRFGRGPADPQINRLVTRTGRGLRKELRRVGLPGAPWAPLLIALRLLRPTRRRQTMQSLSRIELTKVVPAGQVDELHLLLQSTRPV